MELHKLTLNVIDSCNHSLHISLPVYFITTMYAVELSSFTVQQNLGNSPDTNIGYDREESWPVYFGNRRL